MTLTPKQVAQLNKYVEHVEFGVVSGMQNIDGHIVVEYYKHEGQRYVLLSTTTPPKTFCAINLTSRSTMPVGSWPGHVRVD